MAVEGLLSREGGKAGIALRWTVIVMLVALGLSVWCARVPLLRGAAALWITSDPVRPADVAVVLGGGIEDRPFAAASYYRAGLVHKILVSDAYEGPAERLGVVAPSATAEYAVLVKLGVPASAIETFGKDLRNTEEEAKALHAWSAAAGVHSLIVPTEIFSARRVRWTLRRVLGNGVSVVVPALDPPDYDRADWWQNENGVVAFQNEVLKYIYYRLRY